MKNIFIYSFIFILLFGCSSTSEPIEDKQFISITLSNDIGESTFQIVDNSFLTGSIYFLNDSVGYTNIGLFGDINDGPKHISLSFPGNQTGTYNWSSSQFNHLIIDEDGIPGPPLYILYDGQTTIKKYGDVGKKVEGIFSGVIVELTTRDTLMANGEFSVNRMSDSK